MRRIKPVLIVAMVVAFTGFAAKETSLATLGVLYHTSDAGLAQALQHAMTPLVAPPFELTQKAPNRGQVSKEIDYRSHESRSYLRNESASVAVE